MIAISTNACRYSMALFYVLDLYVPAVHKFRLQRSDDVQAWRPSTKGTAGLASPLYLTGVFYLLPIVMFDYFYPRRKLNKEVQPKPN